MSSAMRFSQTSVASGRRALLLPVGGRSFGAAVSVPVQPLPPSSIGSRPEVIGRAEAEKTRHAESKRFVSDAPGRSAVSPAHWEESWCTSKVKDLARQHVMSTWGPGNAVDSLPLITRSEGVYLWDSDGNQFLDWTSQAVCTNLGYTVPDAVQAAVQRQLRDLPMIYSGMALTEVRVRLASLLSELLPGDLEGFLFPSGGSEANEAAIRMARRFTGKNKIINFYRSYHGGSANSLAATGDFRRLFAEAGGGASGFVKTMNPTSSHRFSFGTTEEEKSTNALAYLEEQIMSEGPHTVAAIMLESIVGSGGVHMAPKGYMEGVRRLCDKYGIVFICDEVMVGFGRTGKFWGFQHYDMLPDIVTSAKGLTGAYLPLSMVAVRAPIRDFFRQAPMGWGATFQAHPVAMAAGYECVKYLLEQELVAHARDNLEPIMREQVSRMAAKYDSVAGGRALGAFACLDLVDPKDGAPIQNFDGSGCRSMEAVAALRGAFRENGLIGFLRPPSFHCAPPLVIKQSELEDGWERADRTLAVFDAALQSRNE